jgi:hypothetical protein
MSPGATKLLALPRGCCVYPLGDPALDSFRWSSTPAMPGKPYCERHRRICSAEDTSAPNEIIEESGMRYRLVVARGRNLGDKRQWRVVPVAGGGPARRAPVGVVDVDRYPTPQQRRRAPAARAAPWRRPSDGDGN